MMDLCRSQRPEMPAAFRSWPRMRAQGQQGLAAYGWTLGGSAPRSSSSRTEPHIWYDGLARTVHQRRRSLVGRQGVKLVSLV